MKKLIVLQVVGVLLFSIFVILLVEFSLFSPVSAVVLYACFGVTNIINAWVMLIKPVAEISVHDRLTGCFNRLKLDQKIPDYEDCDSYSIIFFDINNFKYVNDIYGHEVGDKLLLKATEQLKYWEEFDDLYRIGGDEFIVVLPDMKTNKLESKLNKWYGSIPILNEEYKDDFICNFSYGVAVKEKGSDNSFDTVLSDADGKMYAMKNDIKSRENNRK